MNEEIEIIIEEKDIIKENWDATMGWQKQIQKTFTANEFINITINIENDDFNFMEELRIM